MSTQAFVVETSGLTKRFGDRIAVNDVDLRVPRGSAFGYLGPNGAGKTTLIRMLLGLTGATAGEMRLRGRPVPAERATALARVGAIVEEPRFHGHLTGLDPAGIHEFRAMIRGFVAEGRTVLLSSHLLDEVEKICDQVAIVDRGRVVMQGSIEDLATDGAPSILIATNDDERAVAILIDHRAVASAVTGPDGVRVRL